MGWTEGRKKNYRSAVRKIRPCKSCAEQYHKMRGALHVHPHTKHTHDHKCMILYHKRHRSTSNFELPTPSPPLGYESVVFISPYRTCLHSFVSRIEWIRALPSLISLTSAPWTHFTSQVLLFLTTEMEYFSEVTHTIMDDRTVAEKSVEGEGGERGRQLCANTRRHSRNVVSTCPQGLSD